MARKQHGVEQIIDKLPEIEILCNQGNTITMVILSRPSEQI